MGHFHNSLYTGIGRLVSSKAHLPLNHRCQLSAMPEEPPPPKQVKMALIQMLCGSVKTENLAHADKLVREAATAGARLISLPECFNSPYGADFFPEYAEAIPESVETATAADNPTTFALSRLAKECAIYLVGGSWPERDAAGKLYNTCVVFGPDGAIIAKHRKMHLFDIDIPGLLSGSKPLPFHARPRLLSSRHFSSRHFSS